MSDDRPTLNVAETLTARSELLQQHLRERDEILTMAEHAAGIGVWDIDLETQTVRGTPQFWRVMGLPPTDQAVPLEMTRRLRLPNDREHVAEGFRTCSGTTPRPLRLNTASAGRATARSVGFSAEAG